MIQGKWNTKWIQTTIRFTLNYSQIHIFKYVNGNRLQIKNKLSYNMAICLRESCGRYYYSIIDSNNMTYLGAVKKNNVNFILHYYTHSTGRYSSYSIKQKRGIDNDNGEVIIINIYIFFLFALLIVILVLWSSVTMYLN